MEKGDYVRVKNWGMEFSAYSEWFFKRFADNTIKPEYMIRYAYGDDSNFVKYGEKNSDKRVFEILYIDGAYALIAPPENSDLSDFGFDDRIFLIQTDALEKIKVVTLEELEKMFGCKVIIKGENK